jgi:tripartite-type tricarboxylate transporter receptor subunit TctC
MPSVGLIAAIAAFVVGSVAPAFAESWPARPVTMVVSFAAGSGDDVLGRIVAARLSEVLGQQVIVENVVGAGGMNGVNRVAKAAPDGYQFVLGGTGTLAANQTLYKAPLYNATTDFTPVALIAETPMLLIAHKDLPVNNLKEFITYAQANQSKMQYGSGGPGSATHLACVLLNSAIGVNPIHVPYRSAAIAIQDLVAERLEYVCPIISTVAAQIESRQVKGLANLSKSRAPILSELPTANEQGLAGFDAYIWNGAFLPKGMSPPIVDKLHDAIIATLNTSAVRKRIEQIGGLVVSPDRRSADYLRAFVDSEIKKWATPIKASGISID